MALTSVQIGTIVQDEFAKFAILGSKGLLQLYSPNADDEEIDWEAHLKRHFSVPLAIQCKSRTYLTRDRLQIIFRDNDQVVDHDLFYYFFAYLDRSSLGVSAPCFIVPSTVVHAHIRKHWKRGQPKYIFEAALAPESRDQWTQYRVLPSQVGRRVVQILREADQRGIAAKKIPDSLIAMPGIKWLGIPRGTGLDETYESVQQGVIGQNEFAKIAMLTSNGLIELNPAKTDDEHRDFEIHRRHSFGRSVSFQVKASFQIRRERGRRILSFTIGKHTAHPKPLPIDGDFWYFLAYLDTRLMRFRNPVFVIPSKEISGKRPGSVRRWRFKVHADLEPDARDRWVPYRVRQQDLGRRLLELLKKTSSKAGQVSPARALLISA